MVPSVPTQIFAQKIFFTNFNFLSFVYIKYEGQKESYKESIQSGLIFKNNSTILSNLFQVEQNLKKKRAKKL